MEPEQQKAKVLLLCEACGGYHTEDESEEVYVKIIKGKNCVLKLTKDNVVGQQSEKREVVSVATPAAAPTITVPPSEPLQVIKKRIVPPSAMRIGVNLPPESGGGRSVSVADAMKRPAGAF
jgi:hypothetical protein